VTKILNKPRIFGALDFLFASDYNAEIYAHTFAPNVKVLIFNLDQGFSTFWCSPIPNSKLYPSAYPQIRIVPLCTPANKDHWFNTFLDTWSKPLVNMKSIDSTGYLMVKPVIVIIVLWYLGSTNDSLASIVIELANATVTDGKVLIILAFGAMGII